MVNKLKNREVGVTLVELMVAMAISLLVVAAAALIYLNTTKSQRASERQSESRETGVFVLQLLGRDILNAGFYPASFSPEIGDVTQTGMYDTYPPLQSEPRRSTDWQDITNNWPPAAYMTGIYGCDGGKFNVATATCPSTVDSNQSDSIVINYFTADGMGLTGSKKDCTGSDVGEDPSNQFRINDGNKEGLAPKLPLFVSNRYALSDLKSYVDGSDVSTKSLGCSGNGGNKFGEVSIYQPIIFGLKDMRFRYGVFSEEKTMSVNKFYSATEVSGMGKEKINGQLMDGWQRVIAVRVCVLTETQGGGTRLEDAAGKIATYVDCNDEIKNLPVGQSIHRFVQVFGVRNNLKQSY